MKYLSVKVDIPSVNIITDGMLVGNDSITKYHVGNAISSVTVNFVDKNKTSPTKIFIDDVYISISVEFLKYIH